jgi:putative transposase
MHRLTHKLVERLPQFQAADSYYHIVLSGNRRKALFSTVDDRRALNAIAIETLQRFDATLHAYCLMPNHFRALVQIDDRLLSKALRRIATQYSRHRHRHIRPAPHLFERPYTAHRIETDGEFLTLLRSIHLSPVLANRVVAPADYLWSSHRAYLGYKSVAKITTDFGLSLLAVDRTRARVAYHQFITEGLAEDVERMIARKSKAVGAESRPSEPPSVASTDEPPAITKSSFVHSRIQLPTHAKPALPRFGRNRKRLRLRRFLSIY